MEDQFDAESGLNAVQLDAARQQVAVDLRAGRITQEEADRQNTKIDAALAKIAAGSSYTLDDKDQNPTPGD